MASLTVLVTGGSGCVGTGVVRALCRHGHRVLALARSEQSAKKLQKMGAEPVLGDSGKLDWGPALGVSQAVVHCGMDWCAPRDEERILGWMMSHMKGKTIVYTGGTWLFGSGTFSENSPLVRGHGWDFLIDSIEALQRSSDIRNIVVHPPLVYDWNPAGGVCSGWLARMVQDIETFGSVRIVGDVMRRQAVGHTDDVGEVYALALEQGERGKAYNAGALSTTSADMALAAAAVARRTNILPSVLDLTTGIDTFGASANGMNMDQIMLSPASEALGWQPQHTILPGLSPIQVVPSPAVTERSGSRRMPSEKSSSGYGQVGDAPLAGGYILSDAPGFIASPDFVKPLSVYDFAAICKDTQGCLSRILVLGMGGGCDVFAAYALAKHLAKIHVGATVIYGTTVGARKMGACVKISDFLWSAPPDVVPLKPGDEAYGSTRLEESCPRGPEGSPLLFVIPRHTGDLDELTAANVAALVPALRSLDVDLIIGVDNGGDSISGGVDWRVAPEAGRDMQVLHCLKASGIPFIHVVLGPGCDGETGESEMRNCCAKLADQGFLRGAFSIGPFVTDMTNCCRTLKPTRTPNIMGRALSGEMPSVETPVGKNGDYIHIERHKTTACLPRVWMTIGLVFVYTAAEQ